MYLAETAKIKRMRKRKFSVFSLTDKELNMDNPKDAKPLEMPPVLAHVQAAVDKLAACETIRQEPA